MEDDIIDVEIGIDIERNHLNTFTRICEEIHNQLLDYQTDITSIEVSYASSMLLNFNLHPFEQGDIASHLSKVGSISDDIMVYYNSQLPTNLGEFEYQIIFVLKNGQRIMIWVNKNRYREREKVIRSILDP